MKLSYLITFSNETDSLKNLLERVIHYKNGDQIVLLADSGNLGVETQKVLTTCLQNIPINTCEYWERNLKNNYSDHKNWGASKCTGDFIFQIDGDELPSEMLLENIKDIISANPEIEAFWIPRINDFKGVTSHHAKQWGWRLTPSTSIIHEKIIDTNSDEYKFLKNSGYILEETTL